MLWALGVLAEIVLFALSARLPAAFTPSVLILIGGAGALVRWIAMALDPPGALLPLLQCLHGLSFGATHLGTLGVHRARRAGRARGDRARLSRGLDGRGDGGRDRIVGPALRALRRRGLWRDGARSPRPASSRRSAAHRIADEREIAKLLAGPDTSTRARGR